MSSTFSLSSARQPTTVRIYTRHSARVARLPRRHASYKCTDAILASAHGSVRLAQINDLHSEPLIIPSGCDVFESISPLLLEPGYGDGQGGFYAVYEDVFKKLAEQERKVRPPSDSALSGKRSQFMVQHAVAPRALPSEHQSPDS